LPSGIDQLCKEFEAPVPSLCGGSAAAVVAAIAASLVVMVGRNSSGWPEGADAAASAEVRRERLLVLADEDVDVVGAVIAAANSRRRGEGADLVAALLRSSEVPLEIAERAAEVAVLARVAARDGKPPMRADAAAAATLAASAAAVAVSIVAGNLTAPQLGDSEHEVARIREAARVALERAGG
jgi:formiminotetrahydrofolate cyclodeaminase